MTTTATTADELLREAARCTPDAPALWRDGTSTRYADLEARVERAAAWLQARVPLRGSRIAVWLDKRVDTVVALFAAMRAGHVAVPVNPALRPAQVRACLEDCRAAVLVSDTPRLQALFLEDHRIGGTGGATDSRESATGTGGPGWQAIDVDSQDWMSVGSGAVGISAMTTASPDETVAGARCAITTRPAQALERDAEELAILFYTSGSTGAPKGVMVSHANLLAGARAVNAYLGHGPADRLLAALPLSFDAGFSQLTSAFSAGASVVLLDHLFPADVLTALDTYCVTGITAVPPLYLQLLAALERRQAKGVLAEERSAGTVGDRTSPGASPRYFANTGGHLPAEAWRALRRHWPQAQPIAMYGLTEAFRASWLPPAQFEARPGSMGTAIPGGTRLHVLRADRSPCAADEPGELVQQGPLVARGYWNDPARSAQRFRPGPDGEPAVWSGDTVRADAEGYLWFMGRDDEQIKTSGYRVSPTEVEAAAAAVGFAECVALGVPDALLGQAIVLVLPGGALDASSARAPADSDDDRALLSALRAALPAWMVPRSIEHWNGLLPRNANGKFDRVLIRQKTLQRAAYPQTAYDSDGND